MTIKWMGREFANLEAVKVEVEKVKRERQESGDSGDRICLFAEKIESGGINVKRIRCPG